MAVRTTIISAPVSIGMERIVNAKKTPSFDLEVFLAGNGGGGNRKYKEHDIIFAQGDPCDGVFYVQEGKCKMHSCLRAREGGRGRAARQG